MRKVSQARTKEKAMKGVMNMPFVEINVKNEIEKQRQTDPEFSQAWDESRAEYKLIGEMISLRKHSMLLDMSCKS